MVIPLSREREGKNVMFIIFFFCVLVHVFTSPGANVEVRKELLELDLSFYHVGSGDGT